MTGRRAAWFARSAIALVLLIPLAGCVTPATGNNSYRGKAQLSVQAAISETQTARLTLQAVQRHRIFRTTADETVTANESALGSISAAFNSVQPPPESDPLREQTSKLLSDAEDAISAARIATRRGNPSGIRAALAGVLAVIKDLQRAEKQLS
jgi:hypothetical protein